MLTPNDINVLLHHYTSPSDHPNADYPAVLESVDMFMQEGILEMDGDGVIHTTDRGNAFVAMILSVPFPRMAWLDGSGREIMLGEHGLINCKEL